MWYFGQYLRSQNNIWQNKWKIKLYLVTKILAIVDSLKVSHNFINQFASNQNITMQISRSIKNEKKSFYNSKLNFYFFQSYFEYFAKFWSYKKNHN